MRCPAAHFLAFSTPAHLHFTRTRGEVHSTSPRRGPTLFRASVSASIPDAIPDVIVQRLSELCAAPIVSIKETSVGPGQLNRHFRYTTREGENFLVKVNENVTEEFFAAEAASLRALGSVNVLKVPKPVVYGSLSLKGAFLALEYIDLIPFGASIPSVQRMLGYGLAQLHLKSESPTDKFGFSVDNYIGRTLQDNEWMSDWESFFIEKRLAPMLQKARSRFGHRYGVNNESAAALVDYSDKLLRNDAKYVRILFDGCDEIKPCLIHGDLFMGNVGATRKREPILLDPASYYAHHEMDLATMYGRFGKEFSEAYHEVIPRASGFYEREKLYLLYYGLNHMILSGAGFGQDGDLDNPNGYYERCIRLMKSICEGDGSKVV